MDLKEPLADWIRDNGWNPVEISFDPLIEARDNLHRLTLTFEQSKQLTVEDVCEFVEAYVAIKKQQLIDGHSGHPMLIYVWFDELAGTLCIGLVSHNPGRVLPFSCQVDTNASLEAVINTFLRSHYLEGIPNGELTLLISADPDVSAAQSAEPLLVFVTSVP